MGDVNTVIDPAAADDAGLEAMLEKGDSLGEKETPAPEKPEGEKTAEPPKEGPKEGEEKGEKPPEPPVVSPLEERLKKLETQVQDKETFIQKQAREVGELRAKIRNAEIARAREEVKDIEDPAEVSRRVSMLDSMERAGHKEEILLAIPDFADLIDEMADLAKSKGEPDEAVAAFKENPYVPPVPFLQAYAAEARARKQVRGKEEAMKAEIAAATAKAEDVAKKIEAAAKSSGPVIKGGDGGNSKSETGKFSHLTEDAISGMSDVELEEFLSAQNE
jgi:hypothetical protein